MWRYVVVVVRRCWCRAVTVMRLLARLVMMVVVGRQHLLFVDNAKSSVGKPQRQQCLLTSVYSF
jgi:hypothetical protein